MRSLPGAERGTFAAMVGVARSFGYELTAEELARAFSERSAADREAIEGQELSTEELEQVAGGKVKWECSSDYNPDDWCWFDDRCSEGWNFYKVDPRCSTTFDGYGCLIDDACGFGFNSYQPL